MHTAMVSGVPHKAQRLGGLEERRGAGAEKTAQGATTYVDDACGITPAAAFLSALLGSGAQEGQALLGEVEDALEVEREELRPCGVLAATALSAAADAHWQTRIGRTGYSSIVPPHAAPALFTRTCSAFSRLLSSATRWSTCSSFCMSAGMETHVPGPSSFSSFSVAAQSFADREEMYTYVESGARSMPRTGLLLGEETRTFAPFLMNPVAIYMARSKADLELQTHWHEHRSTTGNAPSCQCRGSRL